ncbi:MAG TPA: hypothetical protein VGW40_15220 [Allosphingosinicella sp.]|nr:hypothetical protein [Allosphingosinicella sp.]
MSRFRRRPFEGLFPARRGPARFEGLVMATGCSFTVSPDRSAVGILFDDFVLGGAAPGASPGTGAGSAGSARPERRALLIALSPGARGRAVRAELYGRWDEGGGGLAPKVTLIVAGMRHDVAMPAQSGEAIELVVEARLPPFAAALEVAVEAKLAEDDALLAIKAIDIALLG